MLSTAAGRGQELGGMVRTAALPAPSGTTFHLSGHCPLSLLNGSNTACPTLQALKALSTRDRHSPNVSQTGERDSYYNLSGAHSKEETLVFDRRYLDTSLFFTLVTASRSFLGT